jgi:hypothetical protein
VRVERVEQGPELLKDDSLGGLGADVVAKLPPVQDGGLRRQQRVRVVLPEQEPASVDVPLIDLQRPAEVAHQPQAHRQVVCRVQGLRVVLPERPNIPLVDILGQLQRLLERARELLLEHARARGVGAGLEDRPQAPIPHLLPRGGQVDTATTGLTRAQAGADYRLGGRISSLDSRDRRNGTAQRYNQIVFELIDLESGMIVWSNLYEFNKAAQDDVVYR